LAWKFDSRQKFFLGSVRMTSVRKCSRLSIAALLVVFAAITSSAQMGMRGPTQLRGVWNPVAGSGAAYEMQNTNGMKSAMEFDIVGKDSVGGKDAAWMEMTMSNPRMGGDMVIKELVLFDTSGMQTSRVIMQMPGRPPMEMPDSMTQARKPTQFTDLRNNTDDVGSESVTTPAGTFTCEHYRMKDGSGDAWVSDKVTPFGLVKYQGKTDTMVLTKLVADAKDKIVGTPVPFDPMKMMQQMPQQQPQQ
jgi:hypothetical protein